MELNFSVRLDLLDFNWLINLLEKGAKAAATHIKDIGKLVSE